MSASSGVDWNYPAVLDTTPAQENCSADYPCTWDKDIRRSWLANRNHFGTQYYFLLNEFHDHLLAPPIAFTEAAGNFQVVNGTGMGEGGDAIDGEFLNGAALNNGLPNSANTNNANMATFPDGEPPTCRCS